MKIKSFNVFIRESNSTADFSKYKKDKLGKETEDESDGISSSDIYIQERQKGKTKEESAKFVLDIISTGTWAAWDQEKIDSSIEWLISKYESKVNP